MESAERSEYRGYRPAIISMDDAPLLAANGVRGRSLNHHDESKNTVVILG